MSTDFTINSLIDRDDPLLNFQWACTKLPFNMNTEYVESVSLPFPSLEGGSPVFGGGMYSHFPAMMQVASVNMTFYEDEYMTSAKWLLLWMAKVKNLTKGWYSLPKDYKRDIVVTLFNNNHDTILDVLLIGCWPTTVSNIDLNYTESRNVLHNVTFSIDNIQYGKTSGWKKALRSFGELLAPSSQPKVSVGG